MATSWVSPRSLGQSAICIAIGLAIAQPACAQSELGPAFSTRNASYVPVAYQDIPGWDDDSHGELARNFATNCSGIRRRPNWGEICRQIAALPKGNDGALRQFLHDNFFAYQVQSTAQNPTGKLTGYFEPLIAGSLRHEGPYRYPVYGMPRDLYEVPAATLAGQTSRWLKIDKGRLLAAEPNSAGARNYRIELAGYSANPRDKRYRVRIVGDRVLPYFNRKEIDANGIDAPVLAWIADPFKLYSMQIQGSGKIQLKDGGLVRLAFAGQNGHPFMPNATRGDADTMLLAVKARGLAEPVEPDIPSIPGGTRSINKPRSNSGVDADVASLIAALKGDTSARPAAATRPAAKPTNSTGSSQRPATAPRPQAMDTPAPVQSNEVEAMIALLLSAPVADTAPVTTVPAASNRPRPGRPSTPRPAQSSGGDTIAGVDMSVLSSAAGHRPAGQAVGQGQPVPATGIHDPSFVFFRRIGDGPEGPIGALGVPLTAGRSMAVDPRSIPLGAPVFIEGTEPGTSKAPMRRLMFAQDTGGAIRGSVRGDFFWGFGDRAGRMALATNQPVQMWLLLPKQVAGNAAQAGIRTRSSAAKLPDCVIADEDFCVED
ncbi:MAG: MltA domain-containing protein [Pseudomonadota bacterium]|nr:MltA domain-containing protein [Pseudomonadota bacterium]